MQKNSIREGFLRYLTKPINIDKFTDAIDSALARADGGKAS